jgi:hypothetical protein
MKFSYLLTEYLSLRDDETTDNEWTPIARRKDRAEQMTWLLEQMDELMDAKKEPT